MVMATRYNLYKLHYIIPSCLILLNHCIKVKLILLTAVPFKRPVQGRSQEFAMGGQDRGSGDGNPAAESRGRAPVGV